MRLGGRDLQWSLRGDDVRSLHDDLVLQGYAISDPEREDGYFGDGTRDAVLEFQTQHGLHATGLVDERTARAITAAADVVRPRVVRGRVADIQGRPMAEVLVVAVDREVRNESELGRVAADSEGAYEITYTLDQLARADKQAADLVVRALSPGDGRVLVASPVIHGAGLVETVDLVVPAAEDAPSEFDRYLAELEPALGGMSLAELGAADLDFLAGSTGIAREHLGALAAAERQAAADAADPLRAGDPSVPAAAYYAWFRSGLPTDPAALWARSDEELTSALTASIRGRLVPPSVGDLIPVLLEVARHRRLDERLRPTPDDQPASLGDLLGTMPHPLERQRQVAVATVLGEVRADAPDLGERLKAAGLSATEAVAVQRTLRLGDLTIDHAPLVQALQEHVAADDDASLRSLANLPSERWLDLAYTHGAPAGSDLDAPGYAASLESRVEELHPAATLAAKLSTNRLAMTRPEFAELSTFLAENPAVDLLGTSVDTIAADARFEHVRDWDQLVDGLRQLQRVKALGVTWRESAALLNAGASSALEVVQTGPGRLEQALAGGIEGVRLDAVHAAALASHDLTLTTMVATLPRFASLTPTIGILKDATATAPDAATLPPNLRTLFGDPDDCECRHCASVLSPAAYLVDLLEFVKPNAAALARLAGRRPDLLDLELSCENTETELPHIDLALEILENAVALPLEVDLPAGTDAASVLGDAARDTKTAGDVPIPGDGVHGTADQPPGDLADRDVPHAERRGEHDVVQPGVVQLPEDVVRGVEDRAVHRGRREQRRGDELRVADDPTAADVHRADQRAEPDPERVQVEHRLEEPADQDRPESPSGAEVALHEQVRATGPGRQNAPGRRGDGGDHAHRTSLRPKDSAASQVPTPNHTSR
jgi:hypothetical protein